jgi:hypothetical protein
LPENDLTGLRAFVAKYTEQSEGKDSGERSA